MKLVITVDTWGDHHLFRIYDDWNIRDVFVNGTYIYNEPNEENFTKHFIQFYRNKTQQDVSNIENIAYIDTNNFKPNERFYSPEYYKSDPLNKFKMYGK